MMIADMGRGPSISHAPAGPRRSAYRAAPYRSFHTYPYWWHRRHIFYDPWLFGPFYDPWFYEPYYFDIYDPADATVWEWEGETDVRLTLTYERETRAAPPVTQPAEGADDRDEPIFRHDFVLHRGKA